MRSHDITIERPNGLSEDSKRNRTSHLDVRLYISCVHSHVYNNIWTKLMIIVFMMLFLSVQMFASGERARKKKYTEHMAKETAQSEQAWQQAVPDDIIWHCIVMKRECERKRISAYDAVCIRINCIICLCLCLWCCPLHIHNIDKNIVIFFCLCWLYMYVYQCCVCFCFCIWGCISVIRYFRRLFHGHNIKFYVSFTLQENGRLL